QGATGLAQGGQGPMGQRDPLGRDLGSNGQEGGDGQFRQGGLADNRARDLMDEIHRRSQDQTRPEAELDYLRRLLDWF
ncbi:DUF4175 domain-containing protein, partial [Escherichia coli]|nr:DUF4175 domain-containing protein [Escherichia coli]